MHPLCDLVNSEWNGLVGKREGAENPYSAFGRRESNAAWRNRPSSQSLAIPRPKALR